MQGFWVSMLTFIAVLCACLTVYSWRNHSHLDKLTQNKRVLDIPFLETLWVYDKAGLTQEKVFQYAGFFAAAGAFAGFILFGKTAALLLGILGAAIGPRLLCKYLIGKFQKDFNNQYPQVLSKIMVAVSLMPIKNALSSIVEQLPKPSKTVFDGIARKITSNIAPAQAINEAVEEYDLPILKPLADIIEILDQVGGGEQTSKSFNSLVENVRFKQRFAAKVISRTGELKFEMLISTAIVALVTLMVSLDGGEELAKYQWLTWLGAGILVTGIIGVYRMINRAARSL